MTKRSRGALFVSSVGSILGVLFRSGVAAAQGPVLAPEASPHRETISAGTTTCIVGDHDGFEDADAHTTTDIVCHDLAEKTNHAGGHYEIRLEKLGGKILLVVLDPQSLAERRILLQSFEEVPTASPRVVEALVLGTSIDQTRNVDNVTAQEGRPAKMRAGQVGFDLGTTGTTGIGTQASMSGGVDMGLVFRVDKFALTSHGRLAGIGSADDKVGLASLDAGGRFYFTDTDVSPFVGGGLELAYFSVQGSGSGAGAFGEAGVDFFRSSRVGFTTSLRADLPFFSLDDTNYSSEGYSTTTARSQSYFVPVSLDVGLVFR